LRRTLVPILGIVAVVAIAFPVVGLRRFTAVFAATRATIAALSYTYVPAAFSGQTTVPPLASGWATYHGDFARTGAGPATPAIDLARPVYTTTLDGMVYAEPLVAAGEVIVATENDTVSALDEQTGAVVWRQSLGTPVAGSALPCGDIDPSGLTSTPVIDVAAGVVYVAGRFQPNHHELYALALATGQTLFHQPIDPAGANPATIQQRGALALANGQVYVPFGGLYGDCGNYVGWVVGVPTSGQGGLSTWAVPTSGRGGIWAPSGVALDAAGNVYAATGNATSTTVFDYGNSVVRLTAGLQLADFWAPADWASLSATDLDIGSVGPALLGTTRIFQSGKNGKGYLLNQSRLGGIGGQLFSGPVCPGQSLGGTAYVAPSIYVACGSGITALVLNGDSFSVAWQQNALGVAGPPIAAYGALWTVETGSGGLAQLNAADGTLRHRYPIGPNIAHFATPAAADGLVIVPAGQQIIAFGAP
jgi:outer membrane protein assembly factor BamB